MNFSIRVRLLTSLALMFLSLIVIGGYGWLALGQSNAGLTAMYVDRVMPLRDLKAVADAYAVNIVDTAHKARNGNIDIAEALSNVADARATLAKHWASYEKSDKGTAEKKLAEETLTLMTAADREVTTLHDILTSRNPAALDRFVVDRLYPAIDPVSSAVEKLVFLQLNEAQKLDADAKARFDSARRIMLAAVLLAISIAVFAGFTTVVHVTRPVTAMAAAMRRLAGGDMTADVPAIGRKDEIGDMAGAVQIFKDNMIENGRLSADQVDLEQRTDAERRKALLDLTDTLEASVGGIANSISSQAGDMLATAQSMARASDDTAQQATAAATASEEASANVQTVASATEELTGSVAEVGRQVERSTRIAGQAVEEAEATNAAIKGLVEMAQNVDNVVKIISDIAAQTNLLALNATIEAARAGEAGRGFAVVASEVKALANQTAKATGDIGSQISAMQDATANSVSRIEKIGTTIVELNQIAQTIASSVDEQGAATREIARNVQNASRGTQEVSSNIGVVSQAAGATGAAATQVQAASGELAKLGASLKTEVTRILAGVRAA